MLLRKETNYRQKRHTTMLGGLELQYHPNAVLGEMPGLLDETYPFERIEAQIDVERLSAKLRSPQLKQILRLIFINGFTTRQAADEMGIAVGTANNLKRKLLRRLKMMVRNEIDINNI